MLDVRRVLPTMTAIAAALAALAAGGQKTKTPDWTIPPTASQELNPITPSPAVLTRGRKIFEGKCQRCHGRDGRGRGPEIDPEHPAGNLTDPLRAAFNPDGVMFYKIWNGRESPKMPAFKNDLISKEEVWTVITFVKTFRK